MRDLKNVETLIWRNLPARETEIVSASQKVFVFCREKITNVLWRSMIRVNPNPLLLRPEIHVMTSIMKQNFIHNFVVDEISYFSSLS